MLKTVFTMWRLVFGSKGAYLIGLKNMRPSNEKWGNIDSMKSYKLEVAPRCFFFKGNFLIYSNFQAWTPIGL
jgi:hypothetical protein